MNKQTKTKNKHASASVAVITPEHVSIASDKKTASKANFALCVRALMQEWRQGTVACKGRSDVAHSNKKPWKQKGTGRARAGSARSPLWRGGGVIFGPQERTRTIKVSKEVRKQVLHSLMKQFVENGKVVSLQWALEDSRPKTSLAAAALQSAGLKGRIVLLVPTHDTLTYASFANIPRVKILFFDQPNVFDLANADHWVLLNRDVEHFKTMVSQWQ